MGLVFVVVVVVAVVDGVGVVDDEMEEGSAPKGRMMPEPTTPKSLQW